MHNLTCGSFFLLSLISFFASQVWSHSVAPSCQCLWSYEGVKSVKPSWSPSFHPEFVSQNELADCKIGNHGFYHPILEYLSVICLWDQSYAKNPHIFPNIRWVPPGKPHDFRLSQAAATSQRGLRQKLSDRYRRSRKKSRRGRAGVVGNGENWWYNGDILGIYIIIYLFYMRM